MLTKKTRKKFTKKALEKIKHHEGTREKKYFATNCKSLCLFVYPKPSQQKSYYASQASKKMKEDGTHKYNGRFKYICDLHDKPLEEVMDAIKSKIKEWKKQISTTSKDSIEALVKEFIEHGADGYRVKTYV